MQVQGAAKLWKLPPLLKVYEAFGALADGRIKITGPSSAVVLSSDRNKEYVVELSEDGRVVSSNDNASYWQGYLGYPAIAVLIARGLLERPPEAVLGALAGIEWKKLNERARGDHARAGAELARILAERGQAAEPLQAAAEAVMQALRRLGLRQGRRRRPPQP